MCVCACACVCVYLTKKKIGNIEIFGRTKFSRFGFRKMENKIT